MQRDAALGLTKSGVSSRVHWLLSKCLKANETAILSVPQVPLWRNRHDLRGSPPLLKHSAANPLSRIGFLLALQGFASRYTHLRKCSGSADENNIENQLLKPYFKRCWYAYNQC